MNFYHAKLVWNSIMKINRTPSKRANNMRFESVGPDGIKGSKITLNVQLLAITIFHFWRAYFCRCLSHLLSSALSNEKWLLVTRVYTGPAIHNKALTAGVLCPDPFSRRLSLSLRDCDQPPGTVHTVHMYCTHCTGVHTNHPLDSHLSPLSSLRMAGAGHWTEPTLVTRSLSSGIGSSPLVNTIHWMYRIQLSAKEGYLIYQHA